jgi:FAS-associated factor 2
LCSGAPELIRKLEAVMVENEASLIAARAEREERQFNQTLRQEQDAAYLESLLADQEKVHMYMYKGGMQQ